MNNTVIVIETTTVLAPSGSSIPPFLFLRLNLSQCLRLSILVYELPSSDGKETSPDSEEMLPIDVLLDDVL